jgi:hypothetical protein
MENWNHIAIAEPSFTEATSLLSVINSRTDVIAKCF